MRIQIKWIAIIVIITTSFSTLFAPPPGDGAGQPGLGRPPRPMGQIVGNLPSPGQGGGGPQFLTDQAKQNRITDFKNVALVSTDGGLRFKQPDEFDSISDIDDAIKKLDAVLIPKLLIKENSQFAPGAKTLRDALPGRKQELLQEAAQREEQEAREADPEALMADLKELVKDVQNIVSEKYQSETVEKLEKESAALKADYSVKENDLALLEKQAKEVHKFILDATKIETDVAGIRARFVVIDKSKKKNE